MCLYGHIKLSTADRNCICKTIVTRGNNFESKQICSNNKALVNLICCRAISEYNKLLAVTNVLSTKSVTLFC